MVLLCYLFGKQSQDPNSHHSSIFPYLYTPGFSKIDIFQIIFFCDTQLKWINCFASQAIPEKSKSLAWTIRDGKKDSGRHTTY